ncbi:MAG TPA: bacteriohemerythrin [Geothrix sp.]|nr:bacteriohemerythrin [Geothrix sp.]
MSAFAWNNGYATGLEVVDGHHQHLVGLINQLGTLIESTESVATGSLESIIQELARYADYHFAEEQRLMAGTGVDPRHATPHKQEHDQFRREVIQRAALIHHPSLEGARDLMEFLAYWLVQHMLSTDLAMARQIKSIQEGKSPAAAFEAHKQSPDPSVTALLGSLRWVYEVVSERNNQLKALNQSLETMVAERTQQLSLAKQELEVKERRYRLAVDSSQDGFWIVDLQGRILEANESYARISGYTREELTSMQIPDLEAREKHEDTASHIQKILAQGQDRFESVHRTKDGHEWPVEVIVTYVRDIDDHFYVFLRDITERMASNQALRESEQRFRSLFHNAPVGHALNRMADGWFLAVNQALATMLGYSIEELNTLNYWDLTPKEYESQEMERLQSLRNLGRYGPYEKEYIRKDGSRVPVRLNGSRVADPDGTELILSLVEDLTKEKAAQKALLLAQGEVNTLCGLLPICSSCKKIRDDTGYWNQLEAYITQHSEAHFTHGMCPDCADQFFPGWRQRRQVGE